MRMDRVGWDARSAFGSGMKGAHAKEKKHDLEMMMIRKRMRTLMNKKGSCLELLRWVEPREDEH